VNFKSEESIIHLRNIQCRRKKYLNTQIQVTSLSFDTHKGQMVYLLHEFKVKASMYLVRHFKLYPSKKIRSNRKYALPIIQLKKGKERSLTKACCFQWRIAVEPAELNNGIWFKYIQQGNI
jgi:hypothetical protein